MTDDELKKWNEARLELFAGAKIPPHALAAILHDTRRMDFDRAMRALPIYRAARPYRGFYAVDWARHYEQTRTDDANAGRTDGAAARAAAARLDDEQRVESDKLAEIARYRAIPPAVREDARVKLAGLGWPMRDESRAWRLIVIMWHRGEDVSSILHPSKLCRALPEEKERHRLTRDETIRELRALIHGAQLRIEELEAA